MTTDIAVVGEGSVDLLSAIVLMAKDPAVDVEKLSALMAMQERMEARGAVAAFNTAFAAMEPLLPRIKKNGQVEYKNKDGKLEKAFRFSKWEDVDNSIRPILRSHGFSLSFETAPRAGDGGGLVVTGTLLHVAGYSKSSSIPLALDSSGGKNNIQAAGSTFSYGCRYTTRMLLNLISEGDDDDGVRGGMTFVTAEEAAELTALIAATATNPANFFAVMVSDEVRSIEEVQHADFGRLKQALVVKQGKRQAPA